jgi:lysophospholipase L1-like esterase
MYRGRHWILLVGVLSACSSPLDIANLDSTGAPIICFGNSLTQGEGASPGHDYPSLLAKALGREVINAGVPGDTTQDGLNRLEEDVLSKNPQLVIVEFGGNDFLRGVPKEEVFADLDEMVRRIQERGAMVVLVGVQPGLLGDVARRDYQRIARARKAAFIPNILEGILTDPMARTDHVHPNDQGYERIAQRILRVVEALLKRAAAH